MYLLTDEEINDILCTTPCDTENPFMTTGIAIAKAQARNIAQELKKVGYPQEVILIGEAMRGKKYPQKDFVIPLDKWHEFIKEIEKC